MFSAQKLGEWAANGGNSHGGDLELLGGSDENLFTVFECVRGVYTCCRCLKSNKEIRVYSYDLHLGDMLSDPGDGRGGDNYHDS